MNTIYTSLNPEKNYSSNKTNVHTKTWHHLQIFKLVLSFCLKLFLKYQDHKKTFVL